MKFVKIRFYFALRRNDHTGHSMANRRRPEHRSGKRQFLKNVKFKENENLFEKGEIRCTKYPPHGFLTVKSLRLTALPQTAGAVCGEADNM